MRSISNASRLHRRRRGARLGLPATRQLRSACAIRDDDSVTCWGDNSSGRPTPPGPLDSQPPATAATAIQASTEGLLAGERPQQRHWSSLAATEDSLRHSNRRRHRMLGPRRHFVHHARGELQGPPGAEGLAPETPRPLGGRHRCAATLDGTAAMRWRRLPRSPPPRPRAAVTAAAQGRARRSIQGSREAHPYLSQRATT